MALAVPTGCLMKVEVEHECAILLRRFHHTLVATVRQLAGQRFVSLTALGPRSVGYDAGHARSPA